MPGGDPGDYVIWFPGFVAWPCQLAVSGDAPGLDRVLADLSAITGITFQRVPEGGAIEVSLAPGLGGGESGVTTLTSTNGVFSHAVVQVDPTTTRPFDTVLRHEMGHAMGLGHSSNPGDIMTPGSLAPVYGQGDVAGLHALYGGRCPGAPSGGVGVGGSLDPGLGSLLGTITAVADGPKASPTPGQG